MQPRGRRKLEPAWWAPSGFAAVPTAAIDPPQRAASPAVPALSGPGPRQLRHFEAGSDRVDLGDALKFRQIFLAVVR